MTRITRPRGLLVVVLLATSLSGGPLSAQAATTVFKGDPWLKISEGGIERIAENVSPEKAASLRCVISRVGFSYYWTSRENTELSRVDGPAFTTFVAVNGSGYVRIVKPEAEAAVALAGDTEQMFDYVEHLLIGLRSVTYYGARER